MDLIDRQQAIDALAKHEKSNGHNYTLFVDIVSECAEIIRDLPSAQPEPCVDKSYTLWKESYEELKRHMDELTSCSDIISRQAAIDALDCINGTEEVLRSLPSAQPEEAIPISWIEGKITRFIEMDNAFSGLTVSIMRAMVNEWKREQEGGTDE